MFAAAFGIDQPNLKTFHFYSKHPYSITLLFVRDLQLNLPLSFSNAISSRFSVLLCDTKKSKPATSIKIQQQKTNPRKNQQANFDNPQYLKDQIYRTTTTQKTPTTFHQFLSVPAQTQGQVSQKLPTIKSAVFVLPFSCDNYLT
ncbi:MAG: hypothetical protein ACK5Q1_16350, partial [Limnobacter sp.]